MTTPETAAAPQAPAESIRTRFRRTGRVLIWLAGVAIAIWILDLLGVDVSGWFSELWDQISDVPAELHRCRARRPDRPDVLRRPLVLRDPQLRLPG